MLLLSSGLTCMALLYFLSLEKSTYILLCTLWNLCQGIFQLAGKLHPASSLFTEGLGLGVELLWFIGSSLVFRIFIHPSFFLLSTLPFLRLSLFLQFFLLSFLPSIHHPSTHPSIHLPPTHHTLIHPSIHLPPIHSSFFIEYLFCTRHYILEI